MAEPVATSAETKARIRPPLGRVRSQWDQQPGENDLWYARFMRFVALGPTRSVSLVAKGRRNAYPVPAHWPIQASQHNWRERAKAFDVAADKDPALVDAFNTRLQEISISATNGEREALESVGRAGGYQAPPPEDYEDETPAQAPG